jgi:tetratricopeptide (TPR) repeat protein
MLAKPRYQPGHKIGGRYQVHQALMGGMGEVYLCLDLEEMYPYALKTFQQRYLTDALRLRRAFEKEVATWVALEKHPNIVRCFYMDTLDNQPFMVLEWIAGEEGRGTDLRGWLRRGPLDLQLALDFTIDICRGLIHTQEKQPGLVHRDLKPENILIAQGGLAKITDFGLAQVVQAADWETTVGAESETDDHQSLLSRDGIVGTPRYMAPEQWRAETLDIRTDIYAVGCILYEMLTGRWPFQATTLNSLRRQHLEAGIPMLANNRDQVNAVDTLLAGCLAKQRDQRFASLADLLEQCMLIYQQQFAKPPKATPTGDEFTAIDYHNRGSTYFDLQQYKEALADLNHAIQLGLNRAEVYANRGLAYEKLYLSDEALNDYSRAIELDPTQAIIYSNRGNMYNSFQRYEEALVDLTHAIKLDPKLVFAYINRGNTYASLQRNEEALADYEQAIQLNPNIAIVYANRGKICFYLQRYDEALVDYSRAIQLDSTFAHFYADRGRIYQELQKYEEALSDYTQAIHLDPNNAQVHYNRGYTYAVSLRRFEEALIDFNHAIQLDPRSALFYTDRGNTYAFLERYNEALADFSHAVQIDPTYAKAYTNRGQTYYYDLKAYEKALADFEKAAQLGDSQGAQYATQVRRMLDRLSL